MLKNNMFGYAVMNKELNAYSFEGENLEICKKYCSNCDIIIERIPYISGFSIRFIWTKPYTKIEFKPRLSYGNIFWLHFYWNKEYLHKNGKIVYRY